MNKHALALFISVVFHAGLFALIFVLPSPTKVATVHKNTISISHITLIHPKKEIPVEAEEKIVPVNETVKEVIKKPKPILKKPKPKKHKKVHKKKKLKKKKHKTRIKKKIVSHKTSTPKKRIKEVTPNTQTPENIYLSKYKSLIYEAIQRAKRYPRMAKKLHLEGTVSVSFLLKTNAHVVQIRTSGAHSSLLNAAKKTIIEASAHFPKPPVDIHINVPLRYSLRKQ